MKRVTFLALILFLLTLPSSNLIAQGSGQVTHAPDGGSIIRTSSISIPTIVILKAGFAIDSTAARPYPEKVGFFLIQD